MRTNKATKLLDELKVLFGDPPYNTGSNICLNDAYYGTSLERKYGKSIEELKELSGYNEFKGCVMLTEKEVAKKMLAKGYKYIIHLEGIESLYTKTVGQAAEVMREVYKYSKANIEPIEVFLR